MKKCTGINCTSENGAGHSIECQMAHNYIVFYGAGNRNVGARYAGYTEFPLGKNANDDQKAAWLEGYKSRENNRALCRWIT